MTAWNVQQNTHTRTHTLWLEFVQDRLSPYLCKRLYTLKVSNELILSFRILHEARCPITYSVPRGSVSVVLTLLYCNISKHTLIVCIILLSVRLSNLNIVVFGIRIFILQYCSAFTNFSLIAFCFQQIIYIAVVNLHRSVLFANINNLLSLKKGIL